MINHFSTIRIIDNQTTPKFQMLLKEETWKTVYDTDNVNSVFNNTHCILLRYFEYNFPVIYKSYSIEHNNLIIKGIKISCGRKRNLYTESSKKMDGI